MHRNTGSLGSRRLTAQRLSKRSLNEILKRPVIEFLGQAARAIQKRDKLHPRSRFIEHDAAPS
jgi:hypothetical protein